MLDNADSDWYKQRITIMLLCIGGAFAILLLRLVYLQIIEGKEYRRLSKNNCIRLQSIAPSRGLIFDRKGYLLVDNRPSFDLSIVIKDARPLEKTLHNLSPLMGMEQKDLQAKIESYGPHSSYHPVIIKRDIGRQQLAAIEVHRFELPGIAVDVNPRRHYLNSTSAAHIIGYLGEISQDEIGLEAYRGCRSGDLIGKFGIEKIYESHLRGKRGGRQVEVNSIGQVVRVLKKVDAVPGHNLFLTIDHNLQEEAEAMLSDKTGAVVAMDPRNGDIRAMASSPSFDQNIFVNGMTQQQWDDLRFHPQRPMENKAIQAEYPPASPYKIITAMAALEEGAVDEKTSFFCSGKYKFGNRSYRCWKKIGHGKVDIRSALEESCDVYFYQVGLRLGIDTIAKYASECGLGSLTGIALEDEAAGLVPTSAWKKRVYDTLWQRGETLSVAIGQGYNLITPLQAAVLIGAVANGGKRMVPQIIDRIETTDGTVIEKPEPAIAGILPAKPETLAIIKQSLWAVVNGRDGTARNVRIRGIEFSGKTGTAQVISRKTDDADHQVEDKFKAHAWFVAYAPSENPVIAISVIVEHGGNGSNVAAPIAARLIKTYLRENSAENKKTAAR